LLAYYSLITTAVALSTVLKLNMEIFLLKIPEVHAYHSKCGKPEINVTLTRI
jgi:hypothetical protein